MSTGRDRGEVQENKVYYSQLLETGAWHAMDSPGGDTRVVWRRKTGTAEGLSCDLYWDFPGRTRKGRVNIIRLASLNHFGRL